jgi:hypothetical protein
MDELTLIINNIPNQIENRIHKIVETYNTLDIDPGFFYSLSGGILLGLIALTYLHFYPGDPHSGWNVDTDEDRFYAMKKEIEAETPEEKEKRLAKEGKNKKIKGEVKEMKEETLRKRKNAKKGQEAPFTTNPDSINKNDIMAEELESELKNYKTNFQVEEEAFIKSLEGLSNLEAEAKINVRQLKKQYGVDNLRNVVKGKVYSDAKAKSGCCYWTLRLINWLIPIGLMIGAAYSLNQEYNVNVLNYFAQWFPREAAVFKSFTGEKQNFGVKYK